MPWTPWKKSAAGGSQGLPATAGLCRSAAAVGAQRTAIRPTSSGGGAGQHQLKRNRGLTGADAGPARTAPLSSTPHARLVSETCDFSSEGFRENTMRPFRVFGEVSRLHRATFTRCRLKFNHFTIDHYPVHPRVVASCHQHRFFSRDISGAFSRRGNTNSRIPQHALLRCR